MSTRTKSRTSELLNQGSCVLLVKDESTATKILEATHFFRGRKITCLKFLEGDALKELNRLNNERRLIIKNVPRRVSIQDLELYLHQFGKIEFLFFLKQKKYTFKFRTASVQFKSTKSAAAAKANSGQKMFGSKLRFDSYDHQYKKSRNASSSQLPGELGYQDHSPEVAVSSSDTFHHTPQACHRDSSNATPIDHFLKPTSRKYHSMRTESELYQRSKVHTELVVRYNLKLKAQPLNLA
jgi:RNA recognition motif-containing protein